MDAVNCPCCGAAGGGSFCTTCFLGAGGGGTTRRRLFGGGGVLGGVAVATSTSPGVGSGRAGSAPTGGGGPGCVLASVVGSERVGACDCGGSLGFFFPGNLHADAPSNKAMSATADSVRGEFTVLFVILSSMLPQLSRIVCSRSTWECALRLGPPRANANGTSSRLHPGTRTPPTHCAVAAPGKSWPNQCRCRPSWL